MVKEVELFAVVKRLFVICAFYALSVGPSQAFDITASNALTAAPGETVTVVVSMVDVGNNPPAPVESFKVDISYDATALSRVADSKGSFFPDNGDTHYTPSYDVGGPGQLQFVITNTLGLTPVEGGELLLIDFTVLPTTADGPQVIDLTFVEINEGFFSTLVDGLITVTTPVTETNINAIIWLLMRPQGDYDE